MRGGTARRHARRAEATEERLLALALGHAPLAAACARRAARRATRPGRRERRCGWPLAWVALLALVAAVAPAFFRGQPARLARPRRAAADRRRRHDARHPGAPDRHLDRLAVRDLRRGRRPAGEAGLPMPLGGARHDAAPAPALGALNGAARRARPAGDRRHAGDDGRLARGAALGHEGVWVQDLPAGFQWLGLGQDTGRWLVVPSASRRSWPRSPWRSPRRPAGRLRHRLAIPRRRGCSASGRRVVLGVFVRHGRAHGLAALLTAIQFVDVQTNAGIGLELGDRRGRRRRHRRIGRARHARRHACSAWRCSARSAPRSRSSARGRWDRRSRAPSSWWRSRPKASRACAAEGRHAHDAAPVTRQQRRDAAAAARDAGSCAALLVWSSSCVFRRRHQLPDARQRLRGRARSAPRSACSRWR